MTISTPEMHELETFVSKSAWEKARVRKNIVEEIENYIEESWGKHPISLSGAVRVLQAKELAGPKASLPWIKANLRSIDREDLISHLKKDTSVHAPKQYRKK